MGSTRVSFLCLAMKGFFQIEIRSCVTWLSATVDLYESSSRWNRVWCVWDRSHPLWCIVLNFLSGNCKSRPWLRILLYSPCSPQQHGNAYTGKTVFLLHLADVLREKGYKVYYHTSLSAPRLDTSPNQHLYIFNATECHFEQTATGFDSWMEKKVRSIKDYRIKNPVSVWSDRHTGFPSHCMSEQESLDVCPLSTYNHVRSLLRFLSAM